MRKYFGLSLLFAALALAGAAPAAQAQQSYVIGSSVGLTGYAATIDRAWADGLRLGAEMINKQGGILGRKIKVLVEDNQSQPQGAVTAYNKMLDEGAQIFISGFLSAGNFAAAPIVERHKLPMLVASILPQNTSLTKWMFSLSARPAFDVGVRLDYLAKETKIRKIGVIYDESPFAYIQAKVAKALAPSLGLQVVGMEQFQNSDADVSVQLKKLTSEGAGAILRMGTGPGTLTAARDMHALGLDIPLLTTEQDVNVFRNISAILGKNFFFSADPPQLYDIMPDSDPAKAVIAQFIGPWRKAYGDRDPTYGGRAYDALLVVAKAVQIAGTTDGAKVRDAIEKVHALQGTGGVYNFDESHYGLTKNPMSLAQIIDGKLVIAK